MARKTFSENEIINEYQSGKIPAQVFRASGFDIKVIGGKMKKIIKYAWNSVILVFAIVVSVLALLLLGGRLTGYELFVVQSGSMEPEYPIGSIVFVKEIEVEDLEIGDVITYNLSSGIRVTHRIHNIVNNSEGVSFQTKGDANETVDSTVVTEADIVGKVVLRMRCVGYLTFFVQTKKGKYLLIALLAVAALFSLLPNIIGDNGKKTKKWG